MNVVFEFVYMFFDGLEYVCVVFGKGLDVDVFVFWLSFFFVIGMNFYIEVVKLCVVCLLWDEIMV